MSSKQLLPLCVAGAALLIAALSLGTSINSRSFNPDLAVFEETGKLQGAWVATKNKTAFTALALVFAISSGCCVREVLKECGSTLEKLDCGSTEIAGDWLGFPKSAHTSTRAITSNAPTLTMSERVERWDEDTQPVNCAAVGVPQADSPNLINAIANYDGHLLVACRTRAGKTSTILGAIDRTHTLTGGAADWTVGDPKESLWMGLESLKDSNGTPKVIRVSVTEPNTILPLIAKVNWLLSLMRSRQQQRSLKRSQGEDYNPPPHYLILDEWPTLLKIARECDRAHGFKGSESKQDELVSKVETLIFNGAEDNIRVWIIAQSHSVEQSKFCVDVRNNMAIFAQGRGGDFQSIERALADNWLMYDAKIRGEMQRSLASLRSESTVPIAYTNLGGHQIARLPNLEGIKSKRLFGGNTNVLDMASRRHQSTATENIDLTEDVWR